MKNKKSIYILLPLVLFIWGALIYQFFTFNTTESNFNQDSGTILPLIGFKRDTFSIDLPSKDPFLGKISFYTKDSSNIKLKKTVGTKKIVTEIVWPSIFYKGIVSDIKDKVKVFMVIIDGETYLMKKGELQREILLKDGDKDLIQLYYKKDSKVIFIQ